jgi:hypothetical protein
MRIQTAFIATVLMARAASAQLTTEPFRPFTNPAYRLVNSVAWTPGGDSMVVSLFHRDIQALRGLPADSTVPEVSLYLTRRDGEGWSEPVLLPVSGQFHDYEPAMLPDGSFMVFNSKRPGIDGRRPAHNDLWMVRRTSAGWGEPRPISGVNTFEFEESYATLTGGGRMIFLKGLGNERYDLFESRLGRDGNFGPAVRSSVSTDESGEADPMVAPDGSFLIFTRWDPAIGWDKGCDLWIAFREGERWGSPVPLTAINSSTGPDFAAALSPDGQWLYYRSARQFLRTPLSALLETLRSPNRGGAKGKGQSAKNNW